jgi:hypothetical protein
MGEQVTVERIERELRETLLEDWNYLSLWRICEASVGRDDANNSWIELRLYPGDANVIGALGSALITASGDQT